MKIRNTALNALFYFLYAFGASLIVMLVEWLLVFLIQRFVIVPYPVLTVIRAGIYTVGVLALLSVMGYIEGYREGHCSIGETVAGGALGAVVHLLLSLLFHFDPFISGGVRFAAGLMEHGGTITSDLLLNQSSTGLRLALFLVYTALYIAAWTVARSVGARRRDISRAELRQGETPAAE